tara:strand:+ start:876 stop:1199 length:324 start_codon:yes stop_codon:yes gene_type:complete
MTQRDDGHDFRDSKNKQEALERKQKVERIELGEVMYKFTEIFTTPEEALNKTKEGEEPKFTILNHKVDRVNIKPIKEANIVRGKSNVQSQKDIANKKSATTGKPTNE